MPMVDWTHDIMNAGGDRAIDSFCRDSGLVEPGEARRYINQERIDHGWTLLNLALWWHEYFGHGARAALGSEMRTPA